ncbi:MAG: GNAT family N-acetyltransferase [Gemmatimonadales bacterium]
MAAFPAVLQTARLEIRAPDPAAATLVNAAIRESYDALHAWLPWADHVPDVAETREHLARAQAAFAAGTDHALLIWQRSGAFVGAIGLHDRLGDAARREIGYWIRTSAAGRGYASEAVRAVSAAGFATLAIDAIEIHTAARNVASRRVAERAGFALRRSADERLVFERRREGPAPFTPES